MSTRFLRTIRFDGTDERVFSPAAAPDEWAVSGAFAFAGRTREDMDGKTRQAFAHGFLSVESFGRSTFVCAADLDDQRREDLEHALAAHFVAFYGAPDLEAALPVAQDEFTFIADLVAGVPVNTVFAVQRSFDEAGDIHEQFRKIEKTGPSWPFYAVPEGDENGG